MADTPVSPTNVTALPTAPNRNTQTNPLTYSQTADAWAGALPTWTTQVNNIASNVNFNAESAFDSAAEALASASAAASSASSASTSASNASTSASNAASSASAASTSASNAAASYDLFDDRYLGAKASDPSVDNDGNPLVTGAMYFNTTTNSTRIYNGTGWQDSAAIATSINLATQVSGTLAVANGGTGITSFGAGIATFLGTPSSANLASAVTDETGSGALVFGTSPTLTDPKISLGGTNGTAGQVPVSQGAGVPPVWGAVGGVASEYQEFTTSGTWTKPAGVTWVFVEAVAGGGGGGKTTSSAHFCGGGGGGAGIQKLFRASELAASETVTIGAGGAGGTGTGANGSDGGNTTFGSHLTALGGKAGKETINSQEDYVNPDSTSLGWSCSGSGAKPIGTYYGGDVDIRNAYGESNYSGGAGGIGRFMARGGNAVIGGAGGGGLYGNDVSAGGTSVFAGNGGASKTAANGVNGSSPGGGGGACYFTSSTYNGGTGGNGRVRIWCW